MRFDTIHIPSFGPFTDFKLDFEKTNHDIHLIYGANEAGKSSLLRGIHQMLYGIPGQSKDNFIHDHKNMRIGGSISNTNGTLSFLRKKGRNNTLLDPQGNTIDDAQLERFLGSVNGEFFDSMFGLDTQSLRDGADALLSGEGDLGTQLFSASLGGTPIEAAISKLEDEADRLYKGSGKKDKTILPALAAYKEGEKLAKSSSTKVTAWNALLKDIKSAQAEFDRVDQSLRDNRSRTVKLSNLTSALPTYSKLLEIIKDLAENDAPDVSSDFIQRFRKTLAEQKDISRSLQIQQQNIADQQKELAGIPDRNPALLHQAEVEVLSNGFETYLANLETVDHLQREIESLESALQLFAEQLDLDSRDQIAELSTISEADQSQFRQLAQSLNKQDNLRQLAEVEVAEVESNIVQYLDDLKCYSNSTDTSQIEEQIQLCESHAAEIGHQEDREEETYNLKRLQETLCTRLDLDSSVESVLALTVPSEESIQLELQREHDLLDMLTSHQQKIEAYDEELATEQVQLDRLKAQAAIYSQSDLTQAREDRDSKLNNIKQADSNTPEVYSELGASITLADTIADALHSNAENIAKAETHLSKIEALSLKKQNSERYKEDVLTDLESWSTLWNDRCAAIPAAVQSPTDLLQWRAQWIELCTTINKLAELQHKTDKHNSARQQLVAQMQTSLQTEEASFRSLYSTLKSELKAATRGQGKLESAQSALASAQIKRKSSIEKLDSAVAALTDTQSAWATLCNSTDLSPGLSPELLLDLIDKRNEAQQKSIELNSSRKELETKKLAITDFDTKASSLSELLLDESSEDASNILPKLKHHIAQAQQSHTKATTIQDGINVEQRKLPELELQLEELNDSLLDFQQQAQVDVIEAMEPAILAIESKTRLTEAHATQRDTLQVLAGDTELDDFFTELDELDREQLKQELDTLNANAQPLQLERDSTLKALDELTQQQRDLQLASDTAAAHKQDAANALSLLVTDTERFIRLQYTITFLRNQVEAFRKQSQGPMMEKTSHYFSALTSDRYSGVAAQLDDKGKPQLVALRRNKASSDSTTEIHTNGLSEGTADQLYLALRLAAIDLHLDKHTPIPLILDDLLMTFDDERTKALLPVLAELSKKTQILIFTHHSHLNELAKETAPEFQHHQLPG